MGLAYQCVVCSDLNQRMESQAYARLYGSFCHVLDFLYYSIFLLLVKTSFYSFSAMWLFNYIIRVIFSLLA